MRVAPLIEHGAAHAVVEAICDAVESRGRTAAIAVADAHGELIAFLRMDGALLGSGTLAATIFGRMLAPPKKARAGKAARRLPYHRVSNGMFIGVRERLR